MGLRRSDRRALLLLFTVFLAVWGGVLLDRWLLRPRPAPLQTLNEVAMETLAEQRMGDSGRLSENVPSSSDDNEKVLPQAETFAFDPNTADSSALIRLGLPSWQVKGILKYRAMGGRYHRAEDFKRVPGMTPEVYERLAPFITIGRAFRYYDKSELDADNTQSKEDEHQLRDSLASLHRPEKFKELTAVDLNAADTTLLKRIPGIASYRARQIVRYREKLGGYVSTEQLSEIERLPAAELSQWFFVTPNSHRRINVNTATLAEMGRHPYMGFARAHAIEAHRKAFGRIKSIEELRLLPDFTDSAIARLQPYLTY